MKKFKNSLVLALSIFLFSTVILLVSPLSNAQQLNQVRAYLVPTDHQKSYFPSEQQVQEALAPHKSKAELVSSFPPLEQKSQVFINQFSTPDVQKETSQFVAPDLIMNSTAISERYKQPSDSNYPQQEMKFPVMPRLEKKANNNFPPAGFADSSMAQFLPNNFGSSNKDKLPSFPSTFPVMPFANSNGLNSVTGWNKCNGMGNSLPLQPKTKNINRKKVLGDGYNNWSNFYPNFTDKVWNESLSTSHNLGRAPEEWRSSISIPDPMITTDVITNQFPPIAEELEHMEGISKWDVFDKN